MGKYCYCPTSFNIFTGLFLIALSIMTFGKLRDVSMPTWLAILCLLIGVMIIFLNSVNRVHEKIENLSTEKANRIHAREGY